MQLLQGYASNFFRKVMIPRIGNKGESRHDLGAVRQGLATGQRVQTTVWLTPLATDPLSP